MGLFDLFARRPALSEGLEQYRNTSGAVLLDVRTPEEYRDGLKFLISPLRALA